MSGPAEQFLQDQHGVLTMNAIRAVANQDPATFHRWVRMELCTPCDEPGCDIGPDDICENCGFHWAEVTE